MINMGLRRDEAENEQKNWRLGSILAGLILLYIGAVIAFIIVY